jgi:hypothetical protein
LLTIPASNASFGCFPWCSCLGPLRHSPGPAPGADLSVVLVYGRRDLCEGFRSLSRELAYDDLCDDTSDDPSETTASAFCSDWIARSNKQALLAQMGAGTAGSSGGSAGPPSGVATVGARRQGVGFRADMKKALGNPRASPLFLRANRVLSNPCRPCRRLAWLVTPSSALPQRSPRW